MAIKVHLAKRSKWFGGDKLSSLCGRVRLLSDGMNLTDEHNEVTCKFCLDRMLQATLRAESKAARGLDL